MTFTILRRLKHSELGMFHAYRRLGKEGSKQRAINFDWDVVDRVFPSAKDTDTISITCQYLEDADTVKEADQWLKRQEKNWRFEGNCPKGDYYDFVEPGCIFAMSVDAGVTPAKGSWVVIPLSHPATSTILDDAESGGLESSGMIALFGDECLNVRKILAEYCPSLFERTTTLIHPYVSTGMEPHPLGTFNILANAGHDLPSAVADLIDNSISKDATEIEITFPNPNISGRWMCIRDNGSGMSPEGLREAMKIGANRTYDRRDLGKYGFGLKGASWSQANTLTVVSMANGITSHLTWDRDHLEATGRWDVLSEPIPETYGTASRITGKSGTSVLLTNMRPPASMSTVRGVDPYTVEVAELRAHLGLVFHRFLSGDAKGRKPVTISVNGEQVQPNNPMLHPLTKPMNQRQLQCLTVDSTTATIALQAFVLPNEDEINRFHAEAGPIAARAESDRLSLGGRMNASQGLYFYRLDRLIKWGGWCGVFTEDEHIKLLRVSVDFDRSADEIMKVNISKREVQLSVRLKDEIKSAVKDGRAEARARYDKKPTKETNGEKPVVEVPKPTKPSTGASPIADKKPTIPPRSVSDSVQIRIVATSKRWQQTKGFLGETTIQISESVPQLVALVKAIENNVDAKKALGDFLAYLDETKDA